jgi:autotransporter translocation and assembly factor TamB
MNYMTPEDAGRRRKVGRALKWVGIVLIALPLLAVLFVASPPGTKLVVGRLLPKLNEQLNGQLTVREIGGSLLGRIHLGGVVLRDASGEVVLQAEHVALDYGLRDLIRGRIALGPIFLDRPVVRLVKAHPGEPYTLLGVFEQPDNGNDTARSTTDITIRDVDMRGGTVFATVWREPADPQREGAQQLDTVQVEALDLMLPLIHYSSGTGQRTALLEIGSGRGRLVDPALELQELRGNAKLHGDSITVALDRIALPNSRLGAEAWIITDPSRRRFAASASVEQLVARDISGLITGATIPDDWSFSGDVRASSRVAGAMSIASPNLTIRAAGGTLNGHVTVVGADNEWNAEDSRIQVAGVQIAQLLRAFGMRSTLRARVDGVVTADGRRGSADLRVAGLAGYGVRGPIAGHIRANGSLDAMSVDTRLTGAIGQVTLTGDVATGRHLRLSNVRGDVAALNLAAVDTGLPTSHINGHLEGDVTFGSLPRDGNLKLYLDSSTIDAFQIDTAVVIAKVDDGLLTTETLLIRAPGLQATGSGTFGLHEDKSGDLTLGIDAPSLAAVEPLVGSFTGDTALDLAGAVRLELTAQGSVSDYTLQLGVEGKDLVVSGFEITALEAAATGTPDSLSWTTRADLGHETQVGAAGRRAGKLVAIDSLTIERGEATWVLDQAARVELRDGVWRFENATLRSSDAGTITIAGSRPGDLTITAEALSLAALLNTDKDLPVLEGRATNAGGVWNGTIALLTADRRPLTAEFATNPLRGRLVADSFALDLLAPLVPSLRGIGGRLDGNVAVQGSMDQPRLDGRLELADAEATVPATGVAYHHVKGAFTFSGDALTIEGMEASAGKGTAQISGRVQFARLDRPSLEVRVQTTRFPVMNRRDFLEAVATGELRLVGNAGKATLTGRARVDEGNAYVDRFIRSSGIDLSDPLYAQFVDTTVLHRAALGPGLIESFVDSLTLENVSVDLGDDFWLRSEDASIQLAGRVTVNSGGDATEKYQVSGTVRTVRGIYRMALAPGVTREFTVREGTIQFVGEKSTDAVLDLAVDHNLKTALGEDITITANMTGTIEKPTLTLTSDVTPGLSETEIISYLVFGAPTVQAFLGDENDDSERRSVFEQSAERLVGVLSGKVESAVVDKLGLPVDYFRIKPGEVQSGLAGTELVLGMQVRILGLPSYLRASPRFCPREQLLSLDHIGINLETRLSPQWGIATSVDPVQGCEAVMAGASARPYQFGMDVFWEKR